MPSKHTMLSPDEWDAIKTDIQVGKLTQRDIAYKHKRSDGVIRQIKASKNYTEYQQTYQRGRLPAIYPIYDNVEELVVEDRDRIGDILEKLSRVEERLAAIEYIVSR